MINIISATKFSEAEFWEKSALGLSLARLRFDVRINPRITYENKLGLPSIYNAQIVASGSDDILVFVHDDIWLDDFFLAERVTEGLKAFDVIGIVGNRRRVAKQPTWIFVDMSFKYDDDVNLSGAVGLAQTSSGPVRYFGPAPASCELMDGIFFAASRRTLVKNSVFFDPRFDFHFYDLDFCRTAKLRGLQLGTWPISLTHQSNGLYGTEHWRNMHQIYIEKWGD